MERMINKLRADFALVVATRKLAGLWADGDEAAAGKAIARAIAADDREVVLNWAQWMAKLALADLFVAPTQPAAQIKARACADCKHLGKPGRSEGYCGGREDLVRVYGQNHPLRHLPADGGLSCARFAVKES